MLLCVHATQTLKRIASSARNLGKLLSLKALIRTRSSWISGFSLFNWPAITNTCELTYMYMYICISHECKYVRILCFFTHWFYSSHAKVIMVLLWQLLTAQLVHLSHLSGQVLGRFKTLGVKDDLCNQCWIIRGEAVILPSSKWFTSAPLIISFPSFSDLYPPFTNHSQVPSWQRDGRGLWGYPVAPFVQHSQGSSWWMLHTLVLTWSHDPRIWTS